MNWRIRFERAGARWGVAFGAILILPRIVSGQTLLHTVPGLAAGEQLGAAVALTGDVDGDGRSDFAATTTVGAQSRGVVRVYSGLDAELIWQLEGPTAGQRFGASMARIGDVDGDGIDDLLVGAWSASFTGASQAGLARVLSGASGAAIREHRGDSTQDHFGWAVAALGDLDADGADEYAVSAIDDDDNGGSAGSVRVFAGASGATLYTLRGNAASQVFGTSIARVPDVDGDGVDDIAVGAPYFASSLQPGFARLHSGATGAALWTASGSANMDQFGGAVAGLGDIDGDGRGEVVVGARQLPTGTSGYVRILSGADGAILREFLGSASGAHYGSAVANAGDVDYDGFDDVWIGVPDASTVATRTGRVECLSSSTGDLLASLDGAAVNARLGTVLDAGLDMSGEEGPDLVAGALGEAIAGTNSGSVRAFRPNDEPPPDPPDPPDMHESLEADRIVISWSAREAQLLTLRAPAEFTGGRFLFVGSGSGTAPGFSRHGIHLALNPDRYMLAGMLCPKLSPLAPMSGRLDATAQAEATFQLARQHRAWIGRTFHHAYVVLGKRCRPVYASVSVPVTIVP